MGVSYPDLKENQQPIPSFNEPYHTSAWPGCRGLSVHPTHTLSDYCLHLYASPLHSCQHSSFFPTDTIISKFLMLINLHDRSETPRHRDICASPSIGTRPQPPHHRHSSQNTSQPPVGILPLLVTFFLCAPSIYASHHFPCVVQALLHTFCDIF